MDKEKRNKKKSTARVVAKKYSQKQVAAELASLKQSSLYSCFSKYFSSRSLGYRGTNGEKSK